MTMRCSLAGGWGLVLLATQMAIGADLLIAQAEYDREVLPLLQKYCAECHSRGTSEDRWSFDGYKTYRDLLADQKSWGKAQQLVASHLMPPHGEPAPSAAQRRTLLDWIDGAVFYVDPSRPDPGPNTLRRLNRTEYNNSVRDVVALVGRSRHHHPHPGQERVPNCDSGLCSGSPESAGLVRRNAHWPT